MDGSGRLRELAVLAEADTMRRYPLRSQLTITCKTRIPQIPKRHPDGSLISSCEVLASVHPAPRFRDIAKLSVVLNDSDILSSWSL
jgi:hypothetical protein